MKERTAYLRCFGCLCLLRRLCCGRSSYYSLSESQLRDGGQFDGGYLQQHPQEQLLRLPGRPAWKLAFDHVVAGVVREKN